MNPFPERLQQKLLARTENNLLRSLPDVENRIDFCSNDYLGFAKNKTIYAHTFQLLLSKGISQNGATGSRLISGNHGLYSELERYLAHFHHAENALVFNSGYDANLGFFSAVPQRGDIIFYDEWIHASIRDGIQMGLAKSYKFKHNDLEDLRFRIEHIALSLSKRNQNVQIHSSHIYVVTESVFSMDGDSPDLKSFSEFCLKKGYYFIVDEAHAVGIHGNKGEGKVQALNLQDQVFARTVTFGKALGCHGAAVLGSMELRDYLVNFARSFMYTTALPPHSIATVQASYEYLVDSMGVLERKKLLGIIEFFKETVRELGFENVFLDSDSAIHCCVVPGNAQVRAVAKKMAKKGFDVRPILSPTVPKGMERLRFCLHSFNTEEEVWEGLKILAENLKEG